jgi:hypothetical protein
VQDAINATWRSSSRIVFYACFAAFALLVLVVSLAGATTSATSSTYDLRASLEVSTSLPLGANTENEGAYRQLTNAAEWFTWIRTSLLPAVLPPAGVGLAPMSPVAGLLLAQTPLRFETACFAISGLQMDTTSRSSSRCGIGMGDFLGAAEFCSQQRLNASTSLSAFVALANSSLQQAQAAVSNLEAAWTHASIASASLQTHVYFPRDAAVSRLRSRLAVDSSGRVLVSHTIETVALQPDGGTVFLLQIMYVGLVFNLLTNLSSFYVYGWYYFSGYSGSWHVMDLLCGFLVLPCAALFVVSSALLDDLNADAFSLHSPSYGGAAWLDGLIAVSLAHRQLLSVLVIAHWLRLLKCANVAKPTLRQSSHSLAHQYTHTRAHARPAS